MPVHRPFSLRSSWLLLLLLTLFAFNLYADDSQTWLAKGKQQLAQSHDDEAVYWLEKAAAQHNQQAQKLLGAYYAQHQQWQQASFYQLQQALSGDSQALVQLGQWLSGVEPSVLLTIDWTEVLYQLASDSNPQAQQLYDQWLENKFNQRRTAQLDSAPPPLLSSVTAPLQSHEEETHTQWLWIGLAMCAVLIIVVIGLWQSKRKASSDKAAPEQVPDHQQQLIKQQRLLLAMKNKITQLQKQLEQQQSLTATQSVSDAYALLGFDPHEPLSQRQLKSRYKALAKLYHPDCGGSERQMQKLNQAVKALAQQLKNAS